MTVYKPIKKEDVQKKIKDSKKESLESHLLITLKSLQTYAAATFKFGKKSDAAKDALYAKKEFIKILKEEKKLFRFLLNNLHLMNLDAASAVVDLLDEVKDDTIKYYNTVLNDIEKAATEKKEVLAERAPKEFDTLTESKTYREQVIGLLEDTYSVRKYLDLPDEFWSYIAGKCTSCEMSHEVADGMSFAFPIYDKDGNIASLRMNVPRPNDLYTALLAIQTYAKAYYIYQGIGTPHFLNDQQMIERIKKNYVMSLDHKANHTIK